MQYFLNTLNIFFANTTLIFHFLFIIFVTFGFLCLFINKYVCLIHIPSFAWASYAVFTKTICPLTYLENWFLSNAGLHTYGGSFVSEYIFKMIYLSEFKEFEILFGFLLAINLIFYIFFFGEKKHKRFFGAGNEIRTRDPHVGNVMLYH